MTFLNSCLLPGVTGPNQKNLNPKSHPQPELDQIGIKTSHGTQSRNAILVTGSRAYVTLRIAVISKSKCNRSTEKSFHSFLVLAKPHQFFLNRTYVRQFQFDQLFKVYDYRIKKMYFIKIPAMP